MPKGLRGQVPQAAAAAAEPAAVEEAPKEKAFVCEELRRSLMCLSLLRTLN